MNRCWNCGTLFGHPGGCEFCPSKNWNNPSDNPPEHYGYDFGQALSALRRGKKIARQGWNGKGMWLLLQVSDQHSKMTLPYIYIEYPVGHPAYPNGCRVPWLASQTDLLAEDWEVI